MIIYLLDIKKEMINERKEVFSDIPNIYIIHNDLKSFLDSTKIDCVVSPGNSYGFMYGGF